MPEKPPVMFRNYGMIEFTVNLKTPEKMTDGILDTMSYIYWVFDDESHMEFAIHVRYKIEDEWRTRSFNKFDWSTGLKGLEKYLGKVRKCAFNRTAREGTKELLIELRVLDTRMFQALGPVQEMFNATSELMESEEDNWNDLMQAHYPERYRELLEQSAEYNK
jgi:hypothetical protein